MTWRIDTRWLDSIEAKLPDEMQMACDETAERALEVARSAVPNPDLSRGYAVGALKESGYVISRLQNGYSQAISRAEQAPDTRILQRNQIEAAYAIASHRYFIDPHAAVSVMDFPLTYASLINDGFYHVKARRHIIGVAYIETSSNAVDDFFVQRCRQALANALR